MQIDIAMTAVVRPEIVERTLSSLMKKIKWFDGFRLIINVDPIGSHLHGQEDVVEVASQYIPNMIVNMPKKANHIAAFKWVLANSTSPYVLFWEDDYELLSEIDCNNLIMMAGKNPKVAYIGFDREGKSVLSYSGYIGRFIEHKAGYWVRVKGKSIGGPPSLMRQTYIRTILPCIDGEPDVISGDDNIQQILKKYIVVHYTGLNGNLVRDIGKDWVKQHGMKTVKARTGIYWKSTGK